jgi:hypothetical protein
MKRATFMTVVMARVLATLAEAQSPQPPVPPQSNKAPAQVSKPAPTRPTLEGAEVRFPGRSISKTLVLGAGFSVAAGFPSLDSYDRKYFLGSKKASVVGVPFAPVASRLSGSAILRRSEID